MKLSKNSIGTDPYIYTLPLDMVTVYMIVYEYPKSETVASDRNYYNDRENKNLITCSEIYKTFEHAYSVALDIFKFKKLTFEVIPITLPSQYIHTILGGELMLTPQETKYLKVQKDRHDVMWTKLYYEYNDTHNIVDITNPYYENDQIVNDRNHSMNESFQSFYKQFDLYELQNIDFEVHIHDLCQNVYESQYITKNMEMIHCPVQTLHREARLLQNYKQIDCDKIIKELEFDVEDINAMYTIPF